MIIASQPKKTHSKHFNACISLLANACSDHVNLLPNVVLGFVLMQPLKVHFSRVLSLKKFWTLN